MPWAKTAEKENRKLAKEKARTTKETSATSVAGKDMFKKTAGTKTRKETKERANQKERENQKGKSKDKNNPVTEVSQDDAQSSNSSQIVANFTSDWIIAVTWADNLEEIYESEVEILLDSGAYDHVCGPEFAVHSPLLPRLDTWNRAQRRWQRNTNSRTKARSLSTGRWTDSR